MAINLAHRPDLDDRGGLKGRGRKTATIKRALTLIEKHMAQDRPDRAAIEAALDRYIAEGPRLRERPAGRRRSTAVAVPAASAQRRARAAGMIVLDTSAIPAILLEEEETASFRDRIGEAGGAMVSARTAVELAAMASREDVLFSAARTFPGEPFISVEPPDAEQVALPGDAYRRYGKGHHPAGLDLGDVFAYALARQRNLPLLLKGRDFTRTDIGVG